MKRFGLIFLALLVLGAGMWVRGRDPAGGASDSAYRTSVVERGNLVAQVSTAGAVSPITTVIVGSQLSGQVVEILVDYNSEVKTGQLLARLNSDQIRARLDGARADLAQAKAARRVLDAQMEKSAADAQKAAAVAADMRAQLEKSRTQLADADKTLARQQDLSTRGIVSGAALQTARTQRDTLTATRDSALAQIQSAEAQMAALVADRHMIEAQMLSSDAQVMQRAAMVRQIEVDLQNADIRSPVDGVVVQRNVELGQPVAASLQAPTLFLVAQDLRRIQIQANVDEADVGRVRTGQQVSFNVNAYPGRSFSGVVKQVRLGSQTVQNVVIYTTVIEVDNSSLELRPGMTANLKIMTEQRDNVVRLPNAALRWRPPVQAETAAAPAPQARPAAPPAADEGDSPAGPFASGGAGAGEGNGGGRGGRGGGGFAPGLLIERLKAGLDLSEAQKGALDKLLAERPAGGGAGQGRGGGGGRGALTDRINDILSDEQKPRFAEMLQAMRSQRGGRRDAAATQAVVMGRVYRMGEGGEPVAVPVRLGVNDGAFTEVISGLAPGSVVITGGGPAAGARASGGFRFGM